MNAANRPTVIPRPNTALMDEEGVARGDLPLRAAIDPGAPENIVDAVAEEEGQRRRRDFRHSEALHHQPQQPEPEQEDERADDRVAGEKHGAASAEQPVEKRLASPFKPGGFGIADARRSVMLVRPVGSAAEARGKEQDRSFKRAARNG